MEEEGGKVVGLVLSGLLCLLPLQGIEESAGKSMSFSFISLEAWWWFARLGRAV